MFDIAVGTDCTLGVVGIVIVGNGEADIIEDPAAGGVVIEVAAAANPHVTFCICVIVAIVDCFRIGITVSVGPGTVTTSDDPRGAREADVDAIVDVIDVAVAAAGVDALEADSGTSNPAFLAHVSRSSP